MQQVAVNDVAAHPWVQHRKNLGNGGQEQRQKN
jgi:hypothetical protein